ncbi:hypothetical protein [Alicyclobacillus sp. SO9]|uniref:hypothetical protein n=1 Tax=Alicyclobacillus sp. SO9 TaxID=2665646 RepID=UPI0018E908BA|nr:hypothetical protein [Alicyclobacillus sp. SO9]QQE77608.1 hypothetical protein GI364_16910 [Alicyclobacillus sp. SO9]
MSTDGPHHLFSRQPGRLPDTTEGLSVPKFVAFGFLASIIPVLLLFQKTLLHPSTIYIGENQDSVQFMWYLGWFWHAVLNGHNPLHTSLLNAPIGLNLMQNTSVSTEALLFGPVFYLFNPVLAYNLAFAAGVILTGLAAMLLLRQLRVSRWLAVGGGVLIQLAPYSTAQSADGHINLIFSSVFVLASLVVIVRVLLHSILHPRILGTVFGVLLGMLFYTSAEVFATYAFIAVLSLVIWTRLSPKRVRQVIRLVPLPFLLWGLSITLLVLSPGLYTFFDGTQIPSLAKAVMPVGVFVTDLLNPVLPTSVFLFHIHLTSVLTDRMSGDLSEKGAYFGIPTILILYWAIRKLWPSQLYRGLTILFVAVFVLSLGPKLHILGLYTPIPLPWILIQHIPLMREALPSRLMFYDDVIAVILVIGAIHRVLQTTSAEKRKKNARMSMLALLTLFLLWLPRVDFASQAMPALQPALMPKGEIYKRIRNQPTTLITSSYFSGAYFMGLAAQLKFTVPFTNVYGFPYTSEFLSTVKPQVQRTNSIYTSVYAHLNERQAVTAIKSFVSKRHPRYILDAKPYSPVLPKQLSQALNSLYGEPYTVNGLRLWPIRK